MKKLLLLCLIFPCIAVYSGELTEDYLDIAANYCTYGNYKEALIYLDRLVRENPADADIKNLKNTVERVMSPNEKSYLTSVNKNIKDFQSFKYQGNSEKQLNALSSVSPDFWCNYLLAEYYRGYNDFKNAVIYYEKAINLKPNFSQSYLGIAQVYMESEDFKNALKYLDKYITFNCKSDIAYALRAEANLHLNNIRQAKSDIQSAVNIDENILYLLIESKILFSEKNYEKAKENLFLLSRNIQTAEVYKYIALCYYETGDYENALLNLDKAIILSNDDKTLISQYNEIKSAMEKKDDR